MSSGMRPLPPQVRHFFVLSRNDMARFYPLDVAQTAALLARHLDGDR